MHPTPSILLFTTLAGAGYGLLTLICLAVLAGLLPADPLPGAIGMGTALTLVTAGLLCSLGHLRRPERAWRALGQWQSSWLSREGVAALGTFVPSGLLLVFWVFGGRTPWTLAVLASAGAIATVVCTGMIYQSLTPIPRWHHRLTTPVYLCLSLATGAVLAAMLLAPWFAVTPAWLRATATLALIVAWAAKWQWWRLTDRAPPAATIESATGLGSFGRVAMLEPPHTGTNYLLNEMGYRVARKHAAKLRHVAVALGAVVPVLLLTAAAATPGPIFAFVLTSFSAMATIAGTLVERWLFFAEAKHTMMLYYGEQGV